MYIPHIWKNVLFALRKSLCSEQKKFVQRKCVFADYYGNLRNISGDRTKRLNIFQCEHVRSPLNKARDILFAEKSYFLSFVSTIAVFAVYFVKVV